MPKLLWRPGSTSTPLGEHKRSPDPLAAIYGPTSKCNGEEGGEGRKRKGRGWKRRGRKEREGRDTDWTDIQFNLRDATGKMQQQVCEA